MWSRIVQRMDEIPIPKKILNGRFYKTRMIGRPKNR